MPDDAAHAEVLEKQSNPIADGRHTAVIAIRLIDKSGYPVRKGMVAFTTEEAGDIAKKIGSKVVVKAQVHVGGRGKAGGVKLESTTQEAVVAAKEILGMLYEVVCQSGF